MPGPAGASASIDRASFRDPSGFVFRRGDKILRQVNDCFRADYDALMETGLYEELVESGLLVRHREAAAEEALSASAYKVLEPEKVGFLSFPYEWCFSQLKDAALATLECQRLALAHEMVLKDASAYNIQFVHGRPQMIDTLSFERYQPETPWIAYRQFCQHFLAPLALASYVDIRLLALSARYIDGIPLDLASGMLPARSRLRLGILIHLHLHAKSQRKYADATASGPRTARALRPVSRQQLLGIVDNLKSTIVKLDWRPAGTEWADYTGTTHYTETDRRAKQRLVEDYLKRSGALTVLDLGANTGVYSRVAARLGCRAISCDGDPAAVEKNYLEVKGSGGGDVLPLLIDLASPSPSLGWASQERPSWIERSSVDAVMALALVHHLAIGNNVPLARVAEFLRSLAPVAIVEWVPKGDARVQQLLAAREDIFPDYTREGFEAAFAEFFAIEARDGLGDTDRSIYLLRTPGRG
ncbi:MAG: class I SAM-dependent methyltransferase [Thermoanaerobaculia bacterium]